MGRNYLEYDNARFTLRDDFLLDLEIYGGAKYEKLQARRLFPVSGSTKYITLLDTEENEVAVIRDMTTLMPESREAVEESLKQFYLIPKILRIDKIDEKYGMVRVNAVTDRGACYFEVVDRSHNMKVMFDGRVLVRDTNDNRYEIPDMKKLDAKSLNAFLL